MQAMFNDNWFYQEQQNWQLLGDGYAIEWVDLDRHRFDRAEVKVWAIANHLMD